MVDVAFVGTKMTVMQWEGCRRNEKNEGAALPNASLEYGAVSQSVREDSDIGLLLTIRQLVFITLEYVTGVRE